MAGYKMASSSIFLKRWRNGDRSFDLDRPGKDWSRLRALVGEVTVDATLLRAGIVGGGVGERVQCSMT